MVNQPENTFKWVSKVKEIIETVGYINNGLSIKVLTHKMVKKNTSRSI